MKVIELLTKIANGEDIPKKIKWNNRTYKYVNEYKDYAYDSAYCFFEDDLLKTRILLKHLNDEVEIIEEDKKIERVDRELDNDGYLSKKLNEIIDYLNNGDDKE